MDAQTESEIEEALDFVHDETKVRFHLRRILGKETRYDEVNGHLFKPNPDDDEPTDDWCQVGGCEMAHREIADDYDCPTPLEGYDMDARIN